MINRSAANGCKMALGTLKALHIVALKSSSQSAANDQPVGCKWLQDGTGHIEGFKKLKLCESRGGRPGLLSLIRLCFLWT